MFDDDGKPFPNIAVRLTNTPKIKFITDENRIIKIPQEQNSGSVWVSKGSFNDQIILTEKCLIEPKSEKNAQQIRQPKTSVNSEAELLHAISEDDFVSRIELLVQKGIIQVS